MTELDYLLLALGLFVAWWGILLLLDRRKVLEKHNLYLAGPLLMWKTKRGRELIDRIARRRRFWRIYGDLSILIVGATMVAVTALLIWEASLVQSPAVRANPPSPDLLLGIPGLNRLIPLGYGIFGLAVAIVLHEFCHGILSRAQDVKIQSLGGVFVIVPIGAFVEPDENELRAMPRHERARLYAVGPATNILLAILFAVLFSTIMMGAVEPVHAGVGIVGFTADSPAANAGLRLDMIITNVDGTNITSFSDFTTVLSHVTPGANITVQAYDVSTGTLTAPTTFATGVDNSTGTPRAILGIYALDVSTDYYHPYTNLDRFGGVPYATLSYISLPFQGRAPIQDPEVRFYRVTGPFAALPAPAFWIFVNSLYWLFWLNAMLGATNALPAVPLDGGYIFKDGIESLVVRLRHGLQPAQRDRVVRQVTLFSALVILALILWQMIGPRL